MTQQEFSQTYLSSFTPNQLAAVQTVDGATLLLAVPGSGKTTVLIHRLGYMVKVCNIAPTSILTVTYTVASTEEMKNRFAAKFGQIYADQMEFRTINGICQIIIQYYCNYYGRQAPQLIQDGEQAKLVSALYQQIVGEYPTVSDIKNVQTQITYIKNMRLSDEEIDRYKWNTPQMPEIFRAYRSEMKQIGLMDYDDQLGYALTFLEKCPPVLAHFQDRFRYFCVDESQDTSKIQHDIIKLLSSKHGNVFMVGDEDQSIYGFRAAYPEALLHFEQDYPNAKVLLMEQNFRSTEEVVSVANAFVKENRFRRPKVITPTRGNGLPVQMIYAVDRTAQYQYLFALSHQCKQNTAFLYRNNDTAIVLIDYLERKGLSYNCKKPEESFFSNRVVGDLTDIIHFSHNPTDAQLFMRIYYRFDLRISKKAAELACAMGKNSGKGLFDELANCSEVQPYIKSDLLELAEMMKMLPRDNAVDAIDRIWNRMGYGQYAQNNHLDTGKYAILRMVALNEPSALDLLRRLGELRELIAIHQNRRENCLTLSTIHSSKGLEYECVYLVDVFDGILPSLSKSDAQTDEEIKLYEEERRLYYVAMTRAQKELYLFACRQENSAFTAEVLDDLPHQVVDDNDLLSLMKRNLCGKSYTHKTKGKGTVVAHNDEKLLVHYAGGITELLTLGQLIDQRDRTPVYEKSTVKEKHRPDAPEPSDGAWSGELNLYTPELLKGKRVKHILLGKGKIMAVEKMAQSEGLLATIRFGTRGEYKYKNFALPGSVDKGFISIED